MGKEPRSGLVNQSGQLGRLYFTVKLPQSGGSSWSNKWVREAPVWYDDEKGLNHFAVTSPRVVIGGDDFRIGVHGNEYLLAAEGLVFSTMDTACRALLSRGFDVLVDETCTTENTLLRYLLIDIDAQPVIIDTPAEECERRALASGKQYLVPVIRQMAKQKDELLKDWPATLERVRSRVRERYPNRAITR